MRFINIPCHVTILFHFNLNPCQPFKIDSLTQGMPYGQDFSWCQQNREKVGFLFFALYILSKTNFSQANIFLAWMLSICFFYLKFSWSSVCKLIQLSPPEGMLRSISFDTSWIGCRSWIIVYEFLLNKRRCKIYNARR